MKTLFFQNRLLGLTYANGGTREFTLFNNDPLPVEQKLKDQTENDYDTDQDQIDKSKFFFDNDLSLAKQYVLEDGTGELLEGIHGRWNSST